MNAIRTHLSKFAIVMAKGIDNVAQSFSTLT